MASFNLDTLCTATKLKETSVDILKKEDLVTEEALQPLTPTDLEKLGLSITWGRIQQVFELGWEIYDGKDPTSCKKIQLCVRARSLYSEKLSFRRPVLFHHGGMFSG